MLSRCFILTAALLASLPCHIAHAAPLVPGDDFQRQQDEHKTVIEGQGGGWTVGRLLDKQGRTLLCMATSDQQRLTLTANQNALELRISAPAASLSQGEIYPMTLTIGSLKQNFEMETDGPTTVRTDPLDPADLISLLDAMSKASRVMFDQSGETDRTASLVGSAGVLSLFRACATSAGFAKLAG